MASYEHFQGWVDSPNSVEEVMKTLPRPEFDGKLIRDSGKNKTVLLYDIVRSVAGYVPQRIQERSDCVGNGWAGAVDTVKSTDIYLYGDLEEWVGETCSEDIYGGSRNQIGGGRIRGPGSVGAWAAKYVNQYGTLVRRNYGRYDLSKYDPNLVDRWENSGVPQELLNLSKEHTVKTVSQISSIEDCIDALANGYPIAVCSNQGFSNERDEDGFAHPEGNWAHCMLIQGLDDVGENMKRPRGGVLINNSWPPNWIRGPKRLNQPDGSFWADYEVVDRMLKQGDSFSLSQFNGFPKQELSWRLA